MNYKMLVIDLDDTLLNDRLEISQKNAEALEYAHKKGVRVVFCTGRAMVSVQKYLKLTHIYNDNDFYIPFNGAIISSIGGEIIFEKILDKKIADKVVDIGRRNNVNIQFYDRNRLIVEKHNETTTKYEALCGMKADIIDNLLDEKMTFKVIFNSENVDALNKIKKEVENKFGSQVNTFFSKKNLLEILNKEANKGLAVQFLADYLNIKQEEVIAIGDSFNDSFMIEYAGLGVCVKNGRNEVKAIADYITKKNNNENAVAEVIYQFID